MPIVSVKPYSTKIKGLWSSIKRLPVLANGTKVSAAYFSNGSKAVVTTGAKKGNNAYLEQAYFRRLPFSGNEFLLDRPTYVRTVKSSGKDVCVIRESGGKKTETYYNPAGIRTKKRIIITNSSAGNDSMVLYRYNERGTHPVKYEEFTELL